VIRVYTFKAGWHLLTKDESISKSNTIFRKGGSLIGNFLFLDEAVYIHPPKTPIYSLLGGEIE
jgi:hypothetical protein